MRRLAFLFALTALAIPAFAQEWRSAPEYDVLLTSYDIEPEIIHLKAGEAVRLRFVNNTHRRQQFAARAFFRSAQVRERDADLARDGGLELAPLSTRTIALVPKAGRYAAGSRNAFHRLRGATGTIVVE